MPLPNETFTDLGVAGPLALTDVIPCKQPGNVSGITLGTTVGAIGTALATNNFLGSFTSTQVLANLPAAAHDGQTVYATDFATLLISDGIKWLVIGTPAIPPGAAVLGYKTNVYTVIPSLAEIDFTGTVDSRLYNGCTINGPSNPNASTYSTAANGQLQLSFNPGTGNASGLTTQRNINSQPVAGNLGTLPYLLGSQGFYTEIAFTLSTNVIDSWFSYYLFPQEHNTTQLDSNPVFPAKYEQWHEFDVNESGHGTDFAGGNRGAYHQWAGTFNGAYTLAAAPAQGATSISLLNPWPGETGTNTRPWTIKLTNGTVTESHSITLINASTGPYTITPVVNTGNTTAATVSYTGLIITSNIQTAPIDYTVEHIVGLGYDPVGQTITWWQDGVQQSTISTFNPNSGNTFRDSLHYYPLITMQTRGANTPYTATVRYFASWAP